jgi:lipoyl(octanoyl) transferase
MGLQPLRHSGRTDSCSPLQVYLLGAVEFEAALALQRLLVYQTAGERDRAALVLCEHPPLITVGRQGSWAHLLGEPEEQGWRRWPVRWVNRGGGCILHVPGQLAVYPVLPLDRLRLGVQEYLDQLQGVLLDVLDDFQIRGEVRPQRPGVWVGPRRIADIGVAVRDWVSYYGAVVNVSADLELFRLVRGAPDEGPMTSLERERRAPLRPALVRERLVEHFAARFGFEQPALFFDHPLLARKTAAGALTTNS